MVRDAEESRPEQNANLPFELSSWDDVPCSPTTSGTNLSANTVTLRRASRLVLGSAYEVDSQVQDRANIVTIHSWEHADDCRRLEGLLRASDPGLAHYTLLPERALNGTVEELADGIRNRIRFATAVVVMNTPGLHRRPFSDFEMRTAVEFGKRIVVVQPPREFKQPVPAVLDGEVYRYATWRSDVVGRAIRGEYPQDGRVFDLAEVADRRHVIAVLAAGVTAVSLAVIANVAGSFRSLESELAAAGMELRWGREDTVKVLGSAVGSALLVGGVVGLLTRDAKSAILAAGAAGAVGAAVSVVRTYEARLLGTSRVRILAVESVEASTGARGP